MLQIIVITQISDALGNLICAAVLIRVNTVLRGVTIVNPGSLEKRSNQLKY